MKLLVTGGCGFIGSNFIRYVLREYPDWSIINLDKLTYAGNPENLSDIEDEDRYQFVQGDICDRRLVDALLLGTHEALGDNPQTTNLEPPTAIVNFAAESHVDRSILDATPFMDTNIKGTQTLLDAARTHWMSDSPSTTDHTPVFLQISTDEVYGSIEHGKFTEDSPLRPNSPYAASKASADLLCRAYAKTYNLPTIITRSSNNYGPYQFPEKLIPLMIRNALAGEPLPVYGEGKNVRDWLHVEDNCRAIVRVIERGEPGEIYNIGGDCERRNIDVVKKIATRIRENKFIERETPEIEFVKDRPGHDFRYALDSTKIREEVGWVPTVEFDAGIDTTIDWYRIHESWVDRVITGEYRKYYSQVYKHGWAM